MELLLQQDIHLNTSLLLQILLFLSNRILIPPILEYRTHSIQQETPKRWQTADAEKVQGDKVKRKMTNSKPPRHL
jgi:hypothetical protein